MVIQLVVYLATNYFTGASLILFIEYIDLILFLQSNLISIFQHCSSNFTLTPILKVDSNLESYHVSKGALKYSDIFAYALGSVDSMVSASNRRGDV